MFGPLGTRRSEPNNDPDLGRRGSGRAEGRAWTSMERTSGGLALWVEYSELSVTE